jgi:hypothetical protein
MMLLQKKSAPLARGYGISKRALSLQNRGVQNAIKALKM